MNTSSNTTHASSIFNPFLVTPIKQSLAKKIEAFVEEVGECIDEDPSFSEDDDSEDDNDSEDDDDQSEEDEPVPPPKTYNTYNVFYLN